MELTRWRMVFTSVLFCISVFILPINACQLGKTGAPLVKFYTTPENTLKNGLIQINVTCRARSVTNGNIVYHKMWVERNGTKIFSTKAYYCHMPECNQTLQLDRNSFGAETNIKIFCKALTKTYSCTIISRDIDLLDKLPTLKPTSRPTSRPRTSKAVLPKQEAQPGPESRLNTFEMVGLGAGSLALLLCVIIAVTLMHQHWKRNEDANLLIGSMEQICPPIFPGTLPTGLPLETSFPVYPLDEDDYKDPKPSPDETFSIGPGVTLDIPRPQTILGNGTFGIVVLGKLITYFENSVSTVDVAVKMLKDFDNPKHKSDFEKEVDNLKHLDHVNIVTLHTTYSDCRRFYIIMEYLNRGSLLSLLRGEKEHYNTSESDIDLRLLYKFASDIASGMEYLADQKRIHRDLAARNILVAEDYTCKISDFGLARSIEVLGHYIPTQGYFPLKWVAIEALETKRFTIETDIWSYGIVLWEIFSFGEEPYEVVDTEVELKGFLKEGSRMEMPESCPQNAFELMRKCWSDIPSNRPNFTELKKWATESSITQPA